MTVDFYMQHLSFLLGNLVVAFKSVSIHSRSHNNLLWRGRLSWTLENQTSLLYCHLLDRDQKYLVKKLIFARLDYLWKFIDLLIVFLLSYISSAQLKVLICPTLVKSLTNPNVSFRVWSWNDLRLKGLTINSPRLLPI